MKRVAPTLVALLCSALAAAAASAQDVPVAGVSLKERTSHFFSGEQVVRTVTVAPGSPEGMLPACRLTWRSTVGTAVVQRRVFDVPAGRRALQKEILLEMPEVRRITRGEIHLSLRQDGKSLASSSNDFLLFPSRPPVPGILKGREIVLLDPTGRTAAALDYLGLNYGLTGRSWSAATGSADLVILGSSIPESRLYLLLRQLQPAVAEGTAVLCLEQNRFDPRRFPYVALAADERRWDAWVEPAGTSPVRGELPEEAAETWRPDCRSILRPMAAPARGNFRILLDVTDPAGTEQRLEAAVVEVHFGKGRYLFSQLLVGQRFFQEPAARYVLVNLLVYALTARKGDPARVAILCDPADEAMAEALHLLGLRGNVNPPGIEGYDLIVVPAGEGALKAFLTRMPRWQSEMLTFLDGGGKLVLLGLEPATTESFAFLWRGSLRVSAAPEEGEFDFSHVWKKALFQGLRRVELEGLCRRADHPRISFEEQGAKAPAVADGIIVMEQEEGLIVVCQLPLPEDDEDVASLRTFCQLLTGLDAELELPQRRDVQ